MGSEKDLTLLNVHGNNFRCQCGANVFRRLSGCRYECNACKMAYKVVDTTGGRSEGGSDE